MMPEDITPDTFPKYQPNPLTVNLPDYVKDPANYEKIRKALLDCLATKHSHSDAEEWSKCTECMRQVEEHKLMMKKFGFTSPQQYKAWQKTHETIKKKL
jgi:two-component SAPR family response regulator